MSRIVSTAGSAGQAFALIEREPFDLLISDVGMPEEDGYSLIKPCAGLPSTRAALAPCAGDRLTREPRTGPRHCAPASTCTWPSPSNPGELMVVLETLVRNLAPPT